MKKHTTKPLVLEREVLRDITGGFPTTFGPFTATLRTGSIATQTMSGPNKETKLEA
jgi:hypothetical protein